MSTAPRTAIILHGPPACGKTAISKSIQSQFTPYRVKHISLDDGWQLGDFRYVAKTGRQYEDLASAVEPLLLVEWGCGEPVDFTFPGATLGAAEWIGVLKNAGRATHHFLLWVDWDEAVNRLRNRWKNDLSGFWAHIGLYALYEHKHPHTVLDVPGVVEERIATTGRTVDDLADEILHKCGVNLPH